MWQHNSISSGYNGCPMSILFGLAVGEEDLNIGSLLRIKQKAHAQQWVSQAVLTVDSRFSHRQVLVRLRIAIFMYASTKSHASGKSKNPYFRIMRKRSDVSFDADSESPHMTFGKNATLRSYRRKTAFFEVTWS